MLSSVTKDEVDELLDGAKTNSTRYRADQVNEIVNRGTDEVDELFERRSRQDCEL